MDTGKPRLLTRRVLLYYLLTFILLALGEVLGYLLSVNGIRVIPNSELHELEQLAQHPSFITIFRHNLTLNLLMNIPFVGPAIYVFLIGFTGVALGYIVVARIGLSILYLIVGYVVSALFPHGLLELFAYSLSAYNSVSVSMDLVRRRYIATSLAYWVIRIVISVIILFIAAYVEYLELAVVKPLAHV
ncbi:MAG: stage II sporulation protein M [Caldivirga sp.]|jgi:uncharacterized membrane protein SpoIIM required for sporulation